MQHGCYQNSDGAGEMCTPGYDSVDNARFVWLLTSPVKDIDCSTRLLNGILVSMKLSAIQRQVIYAVTLNANLSVAEVARMLDLREHVVRRTLDLLFEAKVFLRRSIWLNPHRLGLQHHVAHLELPLSAISDRKKFIELMCKQEEVSAMVELGAEAQFELRLLTRDTHHLASFFENLALNFPHPFRVTRCLTTLEMEYSGPHEPGRPPPSIRPLRFGHLSEFSELERIDETDHMVLSALANREFLNLSNIGRILGMPGATLQYRIRRLEAKGVISGHFYVMDPKVFEDLPVALQIRSRSLSFSEKEALKKFAYRHPRVSWVGFFLGEQSAELYTLVRNFEEVQGVLAELANQFRNVLDSVHMTPQLSFWKFSTYPFTRYESLTGKTAGGY